MHILQTNLSRLFNLRNIKITSFSNIAYHEDYKIENYTEKGKALLMNYEIPCSVMLLDIYWTHFFMQDLQKIRIFETVNRILI